MNFIDENCVVFDAEEENKFEYSTIHDNFKKVVENILEGVINELCITPEQFVSIVEKGRQHNEHKRVFDQILAVDNFLSFKKLMVKRNRELECEVMEALQNQNQMQFPENEIQGAQLRQQEAEIEHAIAVSLALEEERLAQMRRDEEMLAQALKLSSMEFEQNKERERMQQMLLEASQNQMQQGQELQQMQQQVPQQPAYPPVPVSQPHPVSPAPVQQAPPIQQQAVSQPISEAAQVEQPVAPVQQQVHAEPAPKKKAPKIKPSAPQAPQTISALEESKMDPSQLPPLKNSEALKEEAMESFAQNQQQNEQMQNKLRDKIGQEGLKERQERLRAQRDLLLKKKMAERQTELENYMHETNGTGKPDIPENMPMPTPSANPTVNERLSKYKDISQQVKQSLTGDSEELQKNLQKARELREKKEQLI